MAPLLSESCAALPGHNGRVFDCTWCTAGPAGFDGSLLTAGEDGTVRVYATDKENMTCAKVLSHGHSGEEVMCVAHCGGTQDVIASGGSDGTVHLWSRTDGEILQVLDHQKARRRTAHGHGDNHGHGHSHGGDDDREQVYVCLSSPSLSQHSHHIVTGASDVLRLFDLNTASPVAAWTYLPCEQSTWVSGGKQRNPDCTAFVFGAAIATAGPLCGAVVAGLGDGTVRITDFRVQQQETAILEATEKWATGVCMCDDGLSLAASYGTGSLKIWDVRSLKQSSTFQGHKSAAYGCLFWGGQSSHLLSWSSDGTVQLWDQRGGPAVLLPRKQKGPVYTCALSPDSKALIVGGEQGASGDASAWVHCVVNKHPDFPGIQPMRSSL